MKRPTFFEGVTLAVAASLVGSALYSVLSLILPAGAALRLLITGLGLVYVLYLLSRSRERLGRVTVTAGWALAAGAIWFLAPPLMLHALMHLGLIWLTRSLYFYSSALSALADLGLNGLSMAFGIWAVSHTGSVFLGLWCFFLMQALFVAIPSQLPRRNKGTPTESGTEDRFQQARHSAAAAIRKLSASH